MSHYKGISSARDPACELAAIEEEIAEKRKILAALEEQIRQARSSAGLVNAPSHDGGGRPLAEWEKKRLAGVGCWYGG